MERESEAEMSEQARYDVVVIGAGPGGYVAAIRASQLGLKTALVEQRKALGGTCLNVGCIPSKALLDTSEFFARARDEAGAHGISLGTPAIDVAAMMKRKDGVVQKLTGGVASRMKMNKVDVYAGVGRLLGAGDGAADGAKSASATGSTGDAQQRVGVFPDGAGESGDAAPVQTLVANNVILATGSAPVELPFLPFDGKTVVDSTGALLFETVPRHLVVVGGGVIGLELGSVWSRLGAKVTVVEVLPQIMNGWDTTVAKTMKRELSKQGIEFLLKTKVTGVKVSRGTATLSATAADDSPVELKADKVLVAVGRRPVTAGSGCDTVGVELDEAGRVTTDAHGRTSVPGIWAVGDIVTGPMLAHKAEDDGMAVAEQIAGKAGHVNYETVPNVIYTWPEAASVGKTEDQLKADGVAYRSGSFPFAANGRALAMDSTGGMVRILADEETDRILGAHIVGPWASDLIGEIVSVMEFGGSAEDIARTVHAHPTLSEVVREAALGVDGRMIHAKN
ncbi:MAG: dihydrolipoyl dehydrogenase [Spirochaeta sp.]|jgi:dihydrolipoamide dehydrogenase|nr:dihydrolipoyl dehydrogenase [Spirochaeta sp.]